MAKKRPLFQPESAGFSPEKLEEIVRRALREDIGRGDITSNAVILAEATARGKMIAKENGVIAGLEVARTCFRLQDPSIEFRCSVKEGDAVDQGQIFATITGPARSILASERVALNFLQRMSGIATLTRQLVEAVKGTTAIILDTRKTVPGLRMLDKWAVISGGGQNHRFGLFDRVLIKDNHIAMAGGISEAVRRVRITHGSDIFIEVEVKNRQELQEAIKLKVQQIMLDNMNLAEMQEAVRLTAGRMALEASGNITLQNVAAVAGTGVNYISTGLMTHSVKALDISLLVEGTN